MISSQAEHPNCMYKWMDYIDLARGQRRGRAVVRRGSGAEQVVRDLDAHRRREEHRVGAGPEVLRQVPRRRPGVLEARLLLEHAGERLRDGRPEGAFGPVGSGDDCKDYNDWVQAWTEIKG